MSERSASERTNEHVATPRAGPAHGAARGDDWAGLLLRWDIAPGTASERALATAVLLALATAVLLDAPRYPTAVRRVAAIILTTFDATPADG